MNTVIALLPSDPKYATIIANNPHISQITNAESLEQRELKLNSLDNLVRTLKSSDQRRPYVPTKGSKSVNHWGQRKLLLSEIEFLTLYSEKNDNVIYAGAAPGTHTEMCRWSSPLRTATLHPANTTKCCRPTSIRQSSRPTG